MTITLIHAGTYQWADEPAFTVAVHGLPAAQGSKAYKGHRTNAATGRRTAVLVEQSKRVKPWRAVVTAAARRALGGRPRLAGAIRADITFTMRKPVSAPKRRRTYPACWPDADKLTRAAFDALTDARVWEDDGRVIEFTTRKVYPGEHPEALEAPGALIRIYTLAPAV